MSDSLRYKIVLWMVWAQIALLPVVIIMMNVTGNGLLWRWNLPNNLMVGSYILWLLALPVSRGLEKPKLLKWWLRIVFWASLILSILAIQLLTVGRYHIDAENGEYVLYHQTGFMVGAPYFKLGKKEGIVIRKLPQSIKTYGYDDIQIKCFKVDTLKGSFYGMDCGATPTAWVCPLDSGRYHEHAVEIAAIIDSLYEAQPLMKQKFCGTFVFPDNFVELRYFGEQVSYNDTTTYDIECEGRNVTVAILNGDYPVPQLAFSKDSVGELSPRGVRSFIERLKGGKR